MVFTMNAFILIVDKIKYLCYPFKKAYYVFQGESVTGKLPLFFLT